MVCVTMTECAHFPCTVAPRTEPVGTQKEGILMAELNINVAPVAATPAPQVAQPQNAGQVAPVRPDRDQNSDAAAVAEKVAPAQKELDNVVSVSTDGDTVQASPESVDRLTEDTSVRVVGKEANTEERVRPEVDFTTDEDQSTALDRLQEDQARRTEVIEQAAEAQQQRAEALEEANEAAVAASEERTVTAVPEDAPARVAVNESTPADQAPTSYAGISNQQLEQLYLKGTISKYDYDSEIASREERTEAAQQNNAEVSEEVVNLAGAANQSLQNFNAIDNAYRPDQDIDEARQATERLQAMDAVQKVMNQ